MVSVAVVTPEYGATLERLFQVPPPLMLSCHCQDAPLAVTTLKEAVLPAQTVKFDGPETTKGGAITDNVAALEFNGLHELFTTQRYW